MAPYTVTTTVQEKTCDSKDVSDGRNRNGSKNINVFDDVSESNIDTCDQKPTSKGYFVTELKWLNIISITILHLTVLQGLISFPYIQKYKLFLFYLTVGGIGGFGVTAGAHRYWCHRSYKANLPLQIILMLCFVSSGQNSIYHWVRDHRIHHKYSETDADPHNAKRGFFFSHVGWLMMKKHPEVFKKGRSIYLDDIVKDPVVQFQEKYFLILKITLCFVGPIVISSYVCDESWRWAIHAAISRYALLLNFTWLVNSAAHMFGNRPYDKTINPRENLFVALVAMGEGWHNYHHTFPWDYRTSEIGKFNVSGFWINFFAKIGWAYDLKAPSEELIKKVIKKAGDGSYKWGEEEISESEDVYDKNCNKTVNNNYS